MKTWALLVRFVLELAALAALLFAGAAIVDGAAGWLLGTAASAAAAFAWGAVVAPRARYKAPTAVRLAVEIAVFAAASLGLLWAGWPVLAGVLAGLYALDRLALWASGAPAYEDPSSIARNTTR